MLLADPVYVTVGNQQLGNIEVTIHRVGRHRKVTGVAFSEVAIPGDQGARGCDARSVADGCTDETCTDVAQQLTAYLAGELKVFTLPTYVCGTTFQRAVWAEVSHIPWGEARTYSDIAAAVGVPRAAQAVGRAVGANPIPIIIPCHRVLGRGGAVTGYSGGLKRKRVLLQHESIAFS